MDKNSNKGISLIALIITIIVIIILAAIVIGGVFNTPNDAKFANFCQEYDRVQTAIQLKYYDLYQKYAISVSTEVPTHYEIYNEVATGEPADEKTGESNIDSDSWVTIKDSQWGTAKDNLCAKPSFAGNWYVRLNDGKLAFQGFEKEEKDMYYTPTAHTTGNRTAQEVSYFNGLTAETATDSETQSGLMTLALGEAVSSKTAKFMDNLSNKTHSFGTYSQITRIVRASSEPEEQYKQANNVVSADDSEYPIYMWENNNIIYWYSEATHPKLPANCGGLFGGFSNLTDASGIRDWSFENVLDVNNMFGGCTSLVSVDLSNVQMTSVTNMASLFAGCSSLTSINLSNLNAPNIVNTINMFGGCCSLPSLNLSGFDTNNVTNMEGMFAGCASLQTLDLSNFNTNNVNDMSYMFSMSNILTASTRKLATIIVSDSFVVNDGTNTENMFKDCYTIVGGQGTTYNSSKVDGSMAHIDGGTSNPGYFTSAN